MLKVICFIVMLLSTSVLSQEPNQNIQQEIKVFKQTLQMIAQAKHVAKFNNHTVRFMRTKTHSDIVKAFVLGTQKTRFTYQEFKEYMVSFVAEYFGEEMAMALWQALGVDYVNEHCFELYLHIYNISDPEACPYAVTQTASDFSFILAATLSIYYFGFPQIQLAELCAMGAEYAVEYYDLNTKVCDVIHEPQTVR